MGRSIFLRRALLGIAGTCFLLSGCGSDAGSSDDNKNSSDSIGSNPDFQSEEDVRKQVEFLTGDILLRDGTEEFQSGKGKTPLSYASTNMSYWTDYVCGSADCAVTDIIRDNPFSVLGADPDAQATQLQVERVLLHQGGNIYDAATWQIALALGAKQQVVDAAAAEELVNNQTLRLRRMAAKAAAPDAGGFGGFTYGPKKVAIPNLQYAYGSRMLGPTFMPPDPFKGTKAEGLVTTPQPIIADGKDKHITWTDFKPITGENAWGQLLGPLQAETLLRGSAGAVPFNSLAVQNAMETLWAFQHMQSPLGAFYYATNGSTGNDGKSVNEGVISIENNFSLLAGLKLLQNVLLSIRASGQSLSDFEKARVKTTVNVIDIMLYGGDTPQGSTDGLLKFLKEYGYNAARTAFYQGGTVIDRSYTSNEASGETNHFAVDVNTWGVSALGPKTVDAWFGAGTSARIWETTRKRGGLFGQDGELLGVGYSDNESEKVLSGEWTFGAVNMVQMLIAYYEANPSGDVSIDALRADEASMLKGVIDLRTDRYATAWKSFQDGIAPDYQAKLPEGQQAFLYDSKRTFVPFGWYGNPLPSTASSTWAIYSSYSFNPFALNGSQTSPYYDLDSPPVYDGSNPQIAWDPSEITVLNTLHDAVITASYKTSKDGGYIPLIDGNAPIPNGGFARIALKDDMSTLGFSFRNPRSGDPNFYGACVLELTPEVRASLRGQPVNTAVFVKWSPDGLASCDVAHKSTDVPYSLPADLAPRGARCDELGNCAK